MNQKRKYSIRKQLKKRNLFTLLVVYLLIKLHFVDDSYKDFLLRSRAYHRLFKKYNKQIVKFNDKEPRNKIIWFCWFQGIENAPKLVLRCLESIKRNRGDYEVIIIDKNNFNQFCEIPTYIIEKWNQGTITHAHFSDILRTSLLVKNGGIWIDSTVYLSGKIDEYILDQELFMFTNMAKEESILFDSWFIVADKKHPLLASTLDILYKYWKKANHLVDYFQYHMFMTMTFNKYYRDVLDIPKYTSDIPHYLQRSYNENFNLEKFNFYLSLSNIHKLTYKYDCVKPGSFLEKILGDENEKE